MHRYSRLLYNQQKIVNYNKVCYYYLNKIDPMFFQFCLDMQVSFELFLLTVPDVYSLYRDWYSGRAPKKTRKLLMETLKVLLKLHEEALLISII